MIMYGYGYYVGLQSRIQMHVTCVVSNIVVSKGECISLSIKDSDANGMHGYVMVATGNRMEDQLLHYVMCVPLMSVMQACTNLYHLPMYLYY